MRQDRKAWIDAALEGDDVERRNPRDSKHLLVRSLYLAAQQTQVVVHALTKLGGLVAKAVDGPADVVREQGDSLEVSAAARRVHVVQVA